MITEHNIYIHDAHSVFISGITHVIPKGSKYTELIPLLSGLFMSKITKLSKFVSYVNNTADAFFRTQCIFIHQSKLDTTSLANC